MKIFLSHASEFDKGEGRHYATVLRRLGHSVMEVNVATSTGFDTGQRRVVLGYPSDVTVSELTDPSGEGDVFLYVEPLGLLPRGLDTTSLTTACIISDVHRNLSSRVELSHFFDQVFLYQRDFLSYFVDRPDGTVHWMPYGCDTEKFRAHGVERDLDVAFVGQLFGRNSERRRILKRLAERYLVNEQRYYANDEIPAVYSRAKIVVNLPISSDLNFRFFEGLSCGAMLLTRRLQTGQEALFTEGVHYAAFESEDELFEKVAFYLAHSEERETIAAAGESEVRSRHGLERRLEGLLDTVGKSPHRLAPVRSFAAPDVLNAYGRHYERRGDINSLMQLQAAPGADRRVQLTCAARSLRVWAKRSLRKA